VLTTERLRLEPWREDDWLQLKPIAQDPEVVRYVSNGEPWPEERIREFVARQIANFEARGLCFWRLLPKGSSDVIGFCGLQPIELDGVDEVEIGWWLARAWWGKGLGTEAARVALRDALERVRLRRVISIVHPANRASIHVMEKLGMSYERDTVRRGITVVKYAIEWAGEL
jgi:RimJ/RimL family protein N-acetyltransferase